MPNNDIDVLDFGDDDDEVRMRFLKVIFQHQMNAVDSTNPSFGCLS